MIESTEHEDTEASAPVSEPTDLGQDVEPADTPDDEAPGATMEVGNTADEAEVREKEAAATIEAAPFERALGEIDPAAETAGVEPASEEPAAATPAEPAAEEAVSEEPAAEEPAVEEPAVEEPAVEEAASEEPAAAEAAEPVAEGTESEEPAQDDGAAADAVDEDAVDEETAALLAWQPGEWFVVHTYAGYENKVKANLETRISSMNMEDRIYEVVIPMEDVVEVKGGKKQVVQRKVFPGYLLVRMDLDDDSWYVVRNTPGVTGFVGSSNKPIPLSEAEVDRILQRGEAAEEERPRPRPEWQVNDPVRVTTGPFANFQGVVSEIDLDRSKLKVLVNIFGRETPVELGFDQVSKV